MGTNCAPQLANWFCAFFELRFLRRLVAAYLASRAEEDLRRVREFLYVKRFIDDIGAINNSDFFLNLSTIYPPYLKFTVSSGPSMDFLDMTVCGEGPTGMLTTRLFDKRRGKAFEDVPVHEYMHWSHAVPRSTKLSIIKSQYARFSRIILFLPNFLDEVVRMAVKLITQSEYPEQCVRRVMLGLFRRRPFVHSHHRPMYLYRIFLRNMRRQLMCSRARLYRCRRSIPPPHRRGPATHGRCPIIYFGRRGGGHCRHRAFFLVVSTACVSWLLCSWCCSSF